MSKELEFEVSEANITVYRNVHQGKPGVSIEIEQEEENDFNYGPLNKVVITLHKDEFKEFIGNLDKIKEILLNKEDIK
jgi:hypothetical protein